MSKRRGRADAATVDRRIDWVAEQILRGKTSRTILQNAAKRKDFKGLSDRSLRDYIAKARDEIRSRGEFDKVDEFAKAIRRLEYLYDLAVQKGDIAAARAVVRDLCNLFGIEGPIKLKVEGTVTVTSFDQAVRLAYGQSRPEGEPDA